MTIFHKNFEAVLALRSQRSRPEIHTSRAIHTQSESFQFESQAWSWDPNIGSIWEAANFESRLWEAKCRECPIASIRSRAMENQLSLMSHWTYHEPIAIRQESQQLQGTCGTARFERTVPVYRSVTVPDSDVPKLSNRNVPEWVK